MDINQLIISLANHFQTIVESSDRLGITVTVEYNGVVKPFATPPWICISSIILGLIAIDSSRD